MFEPVAILLTVPSELRVMSAGFTSSGWWVRMSVSRIAAAVQLARHEVDLSPLAVPGPVGWLSSEVAAMAGPAIRAVASVALRAVAMVSLCVSFIVFLVFVDGLCAKSSSLHAG